MLKLIDFHNTIFSKISAATSSWLLPSLARFTFAATLLLFFWNSARTKLEGNIFTLDTGVYFQILPRRFEALGYDPSLVGFFDKFIAYAGTYAEFVLPALIVIGLFSRLAALGMIGFIAVLSYVDIFGHMVDEVTIGALIVFRTARSWISACSGLPYW